MNNRPYVHPNDIWDAIVDAEVVGSDKRLEEFIRYDIHEGDVLGTFVYEMCVAIACTINAKHPECQQLWD